MVTIDFGEHGGGKRGFKDGAALLVYLDARHQEWQNAKLENPRHPDLGLPARAWVKTRQVVQAQLAAAPGNLEHLPEVVRMSPHFRHLATTVSEAGQAILDIYSDLGPAAASAAIKYYQAAPNDLVMHDLRKDAAEGIFTFRDRVERNTTSKSQAIRSSISKLKSELANDVLEHRHELEVFETQHSETIESMEQWSAAQQQSWASWVKETQGNLGQERSKWAGDWLELYAAYTEKLTLEAPVKLWNDRAQSHEARARWLLKWVVGIGVAGTLIAVAIATSTLNLGHWLLSGYGGDKDGLTLTQLIFAASATLLYLTLFFWTMRIVVRMYMTEQHLGIDARSRAAMAQTYLALIKENAATEQDRAIVLGSMFRPVVDGIVKDDGLPAITPGAILAGLVGGKGQH